MNVETVAQMRKMLSNLDAWIAEAVAYAEERGFPPENYIELRLAPDMFPFRRQVQAATDAAKFVAARTAGKDAPKHEDGEQTLEQLRARIHEVCAFLEGFQGDDFRDAAERVIKPGFAPEGKGLTSAGYTVDFALPNFYFHVAMAYAILRHAGVPLGKIKYIGSVPFVDA